MAAFNNEYEGYTLDHVAVHRPAANEGCSSSSSSRVPSAGASTGIARVAASSYTAEAFYAAFVQTRRPVVLAGDELCARLQAKLTDQFLRDAAGSCKVDVEVRQRGSGGAFGSNQMETMEFGKLLDHVASRNPAYYLTSQESGSHAGGGDGDGAGPAVAVGDSCVLQAATAAKSPRNTSATGAQPDGYSAQELSAPPVSCLIDGGVLPTCHALLRTLRPANVNMWMGFSEHGSSSGLHHDFHDNLYLLVRGAKQFRLFSPADAHRMYTHGPVSHVHPNGLINYVGHATRPDGAYIHDGNGHSANDAATADDAIDAAGGIGERLNSAELSLARAESALQRGEAGAKQRVAEAEAELEAALDATLDAEHGGDDADWCGNDDTGDDDYEDAGDSDGDCRAGCAHRETGVGDGLGKVVGADALVEQASKRRRVEPMPAEHGGTIRTISLHTAAAAAATRAMPTQHQSADAGQRQQPMNFSRIGRTSDEAARFPLYHEATSVEVAIEAGDVLYLPAGWFHEVTSFNRRDPVCAASTSAGTGSAGSTPVAGGLGGGHLAINYWFHPPNTQSSGGTFVAPYSCAKQDGGKP